MSLFGYQSGLKIVSEHNSFRKNLVLSVCYGGSERIRTWQGPKNSKRWNLWSCRLGLGLGILLLQSTLSTSNTTSCCRSSAVKKTGNGYGCWYLIEWAPKSCLLRHVTGLLFCLYLKLFLLSIFNSVSFWSSMSCIVLDNQLSDEKVIGSFYEWECSGNFISLHQKKYKRTKALWCTRNVNEIVSNSGSLDYSELANILPRCKNWILRRRDKTCRIRTNSIDKNVENSDDHGCPKNSWSCEPQSR